MAGTEVEKAMVMMSLSTEGQETHNIGTCSTAADIKSQLSIVVTTSPIPSMPSTALLEALYKSLAMTPELRGCRRILVADGVGSVVPDCQASNYKKSRVKSSELDRYKQYLHAIKDLIAAGAQGFCGTELLALQEHVGFSLAVKAATDQITTPFIMVVQHDQMMLAPVDAARLLNAMAAHPDVLKYVALPSRTTTVGYAQRVQQRYGIEIQQLRVPELETPLLPLLMWYDKTHIVRRDHLLNFVYNPDASGVSMPHGTFTEVTLPIQVVFSGDCLFPPC